MKVLSLLILAASGLPAMAQTGAISGAEPFSGLQPYEVRSVQGGTALVGQWGRDYLCSIGTGRAGATGLALPQGCVQLVNSEAQAPVPLSGRRYSTSDSEQVDAIEAAVAAIGAMDDAALDAVVLGMFRALAVDYGDGCTIPFERFDSREESEYLSARYLLAQLGLDVEIAEITRAVIVSDDQLRVALDKAVAAGGLSPAQLAFIESLGAEIQVFDKTMDPAMSRLISDGRLFQESKILKIRDCQG